MIKKTGNGIHAKVNKLNCRDGIKSPERSKSVSIPIVSPLSSTRSQAAMKGKNKEDHAEPDDRTKTRKTKPMHHFPNINQHGATNGGESNQSILQHYENLCGMTSHEYAMKVIDVAACFSEKAWLRRVNHAMTIGSRGVRASVISDRPYLFHIS